MKVIVTGKDLEDMARAALYNSEVDRVEGAKEFLDRVDSGEYNLAVVREGSFSDEERRRLRNRSPFWKLM